MRNKIIFEAQIAFILMLVAPTLAFALTPYESGYKHGISDGKLANQGLRGNDWYITQPGKGFTFHTQEFNKGYVDGFCSVSNGGSDADEATFECSTDTSGGK